MKTEWKGKFFVGILGYAPGQTLRQKKTQAKPGFGNKSLAIPYFRMANCHTIIGAKRFHFRVRDGVGWFTLAMVTKQSGIVACFRFLLATVFGALCAPPEICNSWFCIIYSVLLQSFAIVSYHQVLSLVV